MALTDANTTIPELSSRTYTTTLTTSDGTTPITAAEISSIKLTILDADGTAINSRNRQNVLNANNGTMHATSGLFTLAIQPSDNVIAGTVTAGDTETHVFIIEVVLTNGTRENHQLDPDIKVTQLPNITS